MVSVSLLEFANTHRPIYFKPETDLEVFDEDEEEWNSLFKTSYSLSVLIEALKSSEIEAGNVRFEDSVAREYLYHLKKTGIDDQLHHEDLMNHDRLVAFADAGYTMVDDLLGDSRSDQCFPGYRRGPRYRLLYRDELSRRLLVGKYIQ